MELPSHHKHLMHKHFTNVSNAKAEPMPQAQVANLVQRDIIAPAEQTKLPALLELITILPVQPVQAVVKLVLPALTHHQPVKHLAPNAHMDIIAPAEQTKLPAQLVSILHHKEQVVPAVVKFALRDNIIFQV